MKKRRRVAATASRAVTTIAIALTWAVARPAFCADALSFPPTRYTILNPDSGATMGYSDYHADETPDGATLHGANYFSDGQVDVETAHIEGEHGGQGPALVDWDHTFYRRDGSLMIRGYFDRRTGAAACISNNPGQKLNQSVILSVPPDTWAGASVVVPIQGFLRRGDLGMKRSLHVFSCAPSAKIFAVSVKIDPQAVVWPSYGATAVHVEVLPDFGLLNPFVASFVPKIHAWLDPNDSWAFLGDEAARWYKGPRVMLVKARDHAGARRP